MRVLYFGTYERDYPRNAQVISALRGAGVEVREQHRAGLGAAPQLVGRAAPDAARRRGRAQPPPLARRRRRRRRADRRLSRPLRPARREAGRAGTAGRLQPARLALRHARRRPRALPARARRGAASCASSTAARSAAPTSSSRTPRRTPRSSARSSACAAERVEVCFVGAEDRLFRPGWQPDAPFHALFVGKLIPLHGLETILAAARARAGDPVPRRRQRPARAAPRRPAAERRVGPVGRVRATFPDEIQARRLRARHLRNGAEGRRG